MEDPHAAPGRLEVLRDFINTVELDHSADALAEGDGLPVWCSEAGVPCAGLQDAALRRLREFREALREITYANAGEGDPARSWAGLEPFAAETSFKIGISDAGVPWLRPLGEGVQGSIAWLLAIVYDAVAAGTWSRLKACREESCRFAFYDNSKNASGAWCSMRVCGNRNKAKRRRARVKATALASLTPPNGRGMMLVVTRITPTRSLKTEQCSSA